jgi:hypothetical protein
MAVGRASGGMGWAHLYTAVAIVAVAVAAVVVAAIAEGSFDESCSDQARKHSPKWREFQFHLEYAPMPKLNAVHVN